MAACDPRYLAIWLKHLPTDRLRLPLEAPLACYTREGAAFVLSAVSDKAKKLGLTPGMALADARAMRPGLVAVEADTLADAALLDRIAAWCGRFSPVVVIDAPDGIVLEVGGSAHLFGGERALLDEIAARLSAKGFANQCALAPTPAAAWALARWSPGAIVGESDVFAALAPLPIRALRLAPESEAFLVRAGLRTVAQIAAAPRAAFAARAGEAALRRLDLALGRAREALSPRRPAPKIFAARRLMEPVFHAEALLQIAETLIGDALTQLEAHNAGVRDGTLTFFGVDGGDLSVAIGVSRPERDARALLRLVREKLQAIPGYEDDDLAGAFGYEAARLDVHAFGALDATTPTLEGGAQADAAHSIAALVDVLSARLGADHVTRPVLVDAHMPEKAEAWGDALGARSNSAPVVARSDDGVPRRPLTMFAHPQPVEALALAPDGPPIGFRWRRVQRSVRRAEGPERIVGDWLAGEGGARDYYRVEDSEGRRYWMYRLGAYGADEAPRWFVHGLFA